MNDPAHAVSVTRTLRLKVRAESYAWLNAAAVEVNAVWNWCNETSAKAARPFAGKAKWLSGFDLNNLSAGATEFFARIGADTIQRINGEYAHKRRAAQRLKLRWRVSRGVRRSLGWIPFKAASLKRRGVCLRFAGQCFRVFDREYLGELKWRDGCFAQDTVGDWYLCLPVEQPMEQTVAPHEAVGIDLGLKTIATTSDGDTLEAGRWTQSAATSLATAQRRGHKRQAKRIHRRIARQRQDALHKFSTRMVSQYQTIIVGDVSSSKLVKTRMAKSVLDSGWGLLKQMLQYKGEYAGRTVQVVNESFTTRTCSTCGSLSGPQGCTGLSVRVWRCPVCETEHDRDVNSAINIRQLGSRCQTSVRGNESSPSAVASRTASRRRKTGKRLQAVAA
jgi:IS605 OrfB family transposase